MRKVPALNHSSIKGRSIEGLPHQAAGLPQLPSAALTAGHLVVGLLAQPQALVHGHHDVTVQLNAQRWQAAVQASIGAGVQGVCARQVQQLGGSVRGEVDDASVNEHSVVGAHSASLCHLLHAGLLEELGHAGHWAGSCGGRSAVVHAMVGAHCLGGGNGQASGAVRLPQGGALWVPGVWVVGLWDQQQHVTAGHHQATGHIGKHAQQAGEQQVNGGVQLAASASEGGQGGPGLAADLEGRGVWGGSEEGGEGLGGMQRSAPFNARSECTCAESPRQSECKSPGSP